MFSYAKYYRLTQTHIHTHTQTHTHKHTHTHTYTYKHQDKKLSPFYIFSDSFHFTKSISFLGQKRKGRGGGKEAEGGDL